MVDSDTGRFVDENVKVSEKTPRYQGLVYMWPDMDHAYEINSWMED